jgi:ribonuclease J
MRDRTQLSQDGMMIVGVTLDRGRGKVVAGPEIVTRGFVYVRESEELLAEIRDALAKALHELEGGSMEWPVLRSVLRDRAQEIIGERTGRRPMILPVIMEL